ncbi:hypothetical protein XH99_20330 [Bradyrhizobium nanningense]|uniref:Uncharacterized protein n=1 Tax=Bradyrhizobium nanningense TaxID=1325118 RepID=A0A4V1L1U2_9BRAD|nr:hypothetical protein [Bradyrhizobium nanningense]RXH26294.1 hypothetical protein XH99_20330 [Bradyrhizobium nanningense]RXH29528.1 hypothetical protein XH84_21140 [Bradyrhizobium nanningense]
MIEEDDQKLTRREEQCSPPRDLIEFYHRWSEYRPFVARLASRSDLSGSERELLGWLILLADRIGQHVFSH